jgi:predicted transcriptional regulator of viral defense system
MHDTRFQKKNKPDWTRLLGVAQEQKGYFTAAQARAAGYDSSNLSHRASTGSIRRIQKAILSHETALEIHGLSDIIPKSVHITVPRERRWYKGGSGVAVHTTTNPIPEEDIVVREGIRVTSPERSIADCAEWGTFHEHIETAVRDALERGLTTAVRIRAQAESKGGTVEALLLRALERAKHAV